MGLTDVMFDVLEAMLDHKAITLGSMLALSAAGCSALHMDRDTYVGTVTDKERVNDGISRYLVFTKIEDGNVRVFENVDSLFELKFNSSDIQGTMEVGDTYRFETIGWRVPFLSMYENIVGFERQ